MVVVAISVTLIIFLNALISGLQKRLISSVTGSIPHIVIKQPERVPMNVLQMQIQKQKDTVVASKTVSLTERKRKIEDWAVWIPRLEQFDKTIIAVSPAVDGDGIMSRGAKHKAVFITGMEPRRYNKVVDIQSKLVKGRFFELNANETAIGYKLADEFSLQLGDKIKITSSEGNSETYTLAGIFDTGFSAVDNSRAFLTLRSSQSLFGLGNAVTSIGIKLDRIFDADKLVGRMNMQIPYEAISWMQENQALLTGLKAQSSSSNLIIAFTVVASGFAIASILIMSVMNRLREIGILKAMGATRKQVIGLFAIEGALLALMGSFFGAVLGSGLALFLSSFKTVASATGRKVETFPIDLTLGMVLGTMAIAFMVGLLAALYPAWKAARTNPVDVIR